MWKELFKSVEKVTKRPLLIRRFNPDNPAAHLRGFIMDSETAQIQGAGDYFVEINDAEKSGIVSKDSTEVALYAIKTCLTHYNRYSFLVFKYDTQHMISEIFET
jgi:hypothetical protein